MPVVWAVWRAVFWRPSLTAALIEVVDRRWAPLQMDDEGPSLDTGALNQVTAQTSSREGSVRPLHVHGDAGSAAGAIEGQHA